MGTLKCPWTPSQLPFPLDASWGRCPDISWDCTPQTWRNGREERLGCPLPKCFQSISKTHVLCTTRWRLVPFPVRAWLHASLQNVGMTSVIFTAIISEAPRPNLGKAQRPQVWPAEPPSFGDCWFSSVTGRPGGRGKRKGAFQSATTNKIRRLGGHTWAPQKTGGWRANNLSSVLCELLDNCKGAGAAWATSNNFLSSISRRRPVTLSKCPATSLNYFCNLYVIDDCT